ncbi:SusC/RagA family TonB-linked outer membrane protein [Algoriphagus resistens]|uniref:SusC/RagA family TonB-linked outer membrane protein n=1 Tax=Algoriphagus resistens TaxID=1750590 RepID=UPI000A9B7566|nr:TonB-dependent receptor [Algoriphagus resistens]
MNRKLLLVLAMLLLLVWHPPFSNEVFASTSIFHLGSMKEVDERLITGMVKDSNGDALPGASILLKGTSIGVISDLEGKFQITIPDGVTDPVLVFSFIGFENQEVPVGNQSVINATLGENLSDLEEVVVVGYGTQKKSDLTGAVSTISGRDLTERKTSQVSQALQGTVPGVMVTRNNNAPGASASIRIRGITTIGDSNPLIIMDGVPVSSIDNINSNDIESISVLKDAASASIYGARAAAGVIVVTTKRAKKGELSLNYNFEYGMEVPTTLPEYVDVQRYMEIANELRWNDNGNNENEYPQYPKDQIDNYYELNAQNPDLYPITDWVDLILKNSAPRQRHAIDISGGGEAIRTKASIVYDRFGGLYMGQDFDRINARINTDGNITKRLSVTMDMFFRREVNKRPSMDPIYNMFISAPIYAAEWSDGRVGEGKTGANIYGQIKYGGFRQNWENQFGGRMAANYEVTDGLKLTAVLSPNFNFNKGKNFQKRVPYYAYDDPTVYMGTLQWANSTSLSESRNDNHQVTTQFLATYDKSYGKHNLNLLAGNENYSAFYESLGASRDQYLLDNFPYLDLGPLEFRGNSGSAYENAYNSFFGRVTYNYGEKYFMQANLRFDGSSRFDEDYRWGSFPSFSLGWVLSEEEFLKGNEVVSFLKIRGSYGTLGNERIGNYPYQSSIGFANVLFHQGSNVVSTQSAAQWQYAIPDISWEKTASYNIGVDANFFNYRLMVSGEYFKKTTSDMLLPLEIPDYIGFDNPDQNTGKMYTNGWEFELSWADDIGELGYSVGFNLSDFKSTMGDLGGIQFLGSQVRMEGSQFDEWYGYQSDGLFQTQEEVDNSAVLNASVRPGDVKYKDISGPNGVPDGKISPEYDRTLLGGSMPRYLYGGNIRLNYKNFDFGLVIQGVGSQNYRMGGLMVQPLPENWGHVPKIIDGNYWSTYNTPEENQNVRYPRLSRTSDGNNMAMSDFWMIDGGYFRLKNISLGYTIPAAVLQRVGIRSIRVYGNASDVFTINSYPKGWDPEVALSGYPITSSFVLGANIQF